MTQQTIDEAQEKFKQLLAQTQEDGYPEKDEAFNVAMIEFLQNTDNQKSVAEYMITKFKSSGMNVSREDMLVCIKDTLQNYPINVQA